MTGAFMESLLDHLAELATTALGTVVHVGAGSGEVLDVYKRMKLERLLLIEGDPDTGAALRSRALDAAWANVCVQPVSAEAGSVDWHAYNLPMLNGPLDAMALASYFPRLRPAAARALTSLALAPLLASQELDAGTHRPHLLIVDVPGQESALLASLPQELMSRFGIVIVRGCRQAIAPGGEAAERAVEELRSRGYDVQASNSASGPLWPITRLGFDDRRQGLMNEVRQTGARAAELDAIVRLREQRISELELELDAMRSGADSATKQHAGLVVERETQSKAALQAVADSAQSTAALEARVSALTAELEGQARAGTEQLAAARSDADRQLAECAQRESTLQNQLKVAEDQLAAARAEAVGGAAALQGQLGEARQSAAIALKLQLLREGDLKQLQDRYKTAQAKLRDQNELLGKVAQRLSAANHYFLQLAENGGGNDPAHQTANRLAIDATHAPAARTDSDRASDAERADSAAP